jgi:hypothetical protein
MKTKTIKLDVTQAIITHADLLAERHASYVSEFVTRANSELYAILAEVLKLHEQVEASKQRDKLIKQMRVRLKEHHKIKTQANTTTTALVTKYVTRASRKTAHVYSRVLQVAIANGVTSEGLVAYIENSGGIDKVRMAVNSAEAIKQANATVKSCQQQLRTQLSHKRAVGSLNLSAVKHTLPCASDVDFYHLLCRFNHATNTHEVVAVMYPSSALETQAMSEYLTMLDLAGVSDSHNQFYDKCKSVGVNMDILLRWMAANRIDSADAARQMARALTASANQPLHTIPSVSLLKAA